MEEEILHRAWPDQESVQPIASSATGRCIFASYRAPIRPCVLARLRKNLHVEPPKLRFTPSLFLFSRASVQVIHIDSMDSPFFPFLNEEKTTVLEDYLSGAVHRHAIGQLFLTRSTMSSLQMNSGLPDRICRPINLVTSASKLFFSCPALVEPDSVRRPGVCFFEFLDNLFGSMRTHSFMGYRVTFGGPLATSYLGTALAAPAWARNALNDERDVCRRKSPSATVGRFLRDPTRWVLQSLEVQALSIIGFLLGILGGGLVAAGW